MPAGGGQKANKRTEFSVDGNILMTLTLYLISTTTATLYCEISFSLVGPYNAGPKSAVILRVTNKGLALKRPVY
jgi:hypothetical protein